MGGRTRRDGADVRAGRGAGKDLGEAEGDGEGEVTAAGGGADGRWEALFGGDSGGGGGGDEARDGVGVGLVAGNMDATLAGRLKRAVEGPGLSERAMKRAHDEARKKGVVYLSRVPPKLRPAKLRQLLEPHGSVLRIYLAPEDPAQRKRRRRTGGDSGKRFTEGWIEWADKRDAKKAVALLNGQPMGGRRRRESQYSDLWNLKYLSGFSWTDLSEEIAYEAAVRDQKLNAELAQAGREKDFYFGKVNQKRSIDEMAKRRQAKGQGGGGGGGGGGGDGDGDGDGGTKAKVLRTFKQRAVKQDEGVKPDKREAILSRLVGASKDA